MANEARRAELAITNLISNKGEWKNRFIKNAPKINKIRLNKKKTPQKSRVCLPYIFAEHGIMAHNP